MRTTFFSMSINSNSLLSLSFAQSFPSSCRSLYYHTRTIAACLLSLSQFADAQRKKKKGRRRMFRKERKEIMMLIKKKSYGHFCKKISDKLVIIFRLAIMLTKKNSIYAGKFTLHILIRNLQIIAGLSFFY